MRGWGYSSEARPVPRASALADLRRCWHPGVTGYFEMAQPLAQCDHHRVELGRIRAVNPAALLDRTDGLIVRHDCMPFEAAWREKDESSRPACRSGTHSACFRRTTIC
jgi:hypothetical protein